MFDCTTGTTLPGSPMAAPDVTAKRVLADTTAVAEFYRTIFGRNSLDRHGMTLQSSIHYGVGYNKDKPELCEFISDTLTAAEKDGTWDQAFEATLGKSGVKTPTPPTLDSCP